MSHHETTLYWGCLLFSRWFQRPRSDEPHSETDKSPTIPVGLRVYAIGDIHGRIDLVRELEDKIAHDIATQLPATNIVVYLGDYVDRGYNSSEVLDHLIDRPLAGAYPVWLLGNHDAWLRDFVRNRTDGVSWLAYGGDATLVSYGVRIDSRLMDPERLDAARRQMVERLPALHLDFLDALEPGFGLGDYFFVHAGVNPTLPLDEQKANDLLWIRDPFLVHKGSYGKIVVHGHTVVDRPEIHHNRIAVDTGACWTGLLTCLVLEGETRRFLATGPLASEIEAVFSGANTTLLGGSRSTSNFETGPA